ncbi:MAG: N-acetyltransferase family protein [Sphingomicrobium sp.]
MSPILIRAAFPADSPAIACIYGHHARNGTATFDVEGPGADDWAVKISALDSRGWPFLVAQSEGQVVGLAYAAQFRDRPAYVHACESSIYVASDHVGRGIGSKLLEALKTAALNAGFDQMIAVVGGGEPASIALHRKCGFVERGRMVDVGLKFGRRLDTVYLQCALANSAANSGANPGAA